MANLEDQSIGELEFRINMLNFVLRWLRSGDAMLKDPKWSIYVPEAIERYTEQRAQLIEICRQKKIIRDGDPNTHPVNIKVKSAEMTNFAKIG